MSIIVHMLQEQNNLFHQRPKVTQIDGFKKKSYHQSGNAVDIFISEMLRNNEFGL